MPLQLILDCDPGTDDALAMMLALLHPDLQLVAVTTASGNVPVDVGTENALRVLDFFDRGDIPVYQGCADPIARWDFPVPRAKRGENDMHGSFLSLPPAVSKKQDQPAAVFLAEYFAGRSGRETETVLVATGPLSNLALAMKLDPGFRQHVKRLVAMGGGHEVPSVNASAEFNIWVDPDAAHLVLTSGIDDIVLVPLDATHQALLSAQDCHRFRRLGTPAGDTAATLVERRIRAHTASQPLSRTDVAAVHDALCVAFLLDPAVIATEKLWVDVETCGNLTLGRTVIDTHRRQGGEPNVWVAMGADERRFVDILMSTFARAPGN